MFKGLLKLREKDNLLLFLLVLVGSLSWSLTMVKSGLVYSYGMGFWGPNGHDGVWHLAVINSLARGSFEMPIFAGESIKNYHIGFDLLLAFLHKITRIPSQNLYFQVVPAITAVITGVLTYSLVLLWRNSRVQAWWATFFVYFGGSFGFLVTLFRSWDVGGESLFWSQQAISTLLNPPFAVSLVLILLGLIFLLKYENNRSKLSFLVVALLFGILLPIKVYAGVLVLGGLFMVAGFEFIRKGRLDYAVLFLFSTALSAILFLPFNKSSGDLVVFQPFWFLETLMAYSDRFYWPRFYEAMVTYKMGNVWVKAVPAYLVAFAIFLLGNFGSRILGVFRLFVSRSFHPLRVFFVVVFVFGIFFPMFFLQKGTPWNTIQFFYYSLFVLAIYAGVRLGSFVEGKSRYGLLGKVLIVAVAVLVTAPSSYSTLGHYLPQRPPAMISRAELEALEFLRGQEDGVVLTYPFDKGAAERARENPPRPLYLYESSAYVSAFSDKPVFLEDEVNLDITGYDWPRRRKAVEDWLDTLDHGKARSFPRDNNISYVYWTKGQRARLGEGQWGGVRIFENEEVEIYRVD